MSNRAKHNLTTYGRAGPMETLTTWQQFNFSTGTGLADSATTRWNHKALDLLAHAFPLFEHKRKAIGQNLARPFGKSIAPAVSHPSGKVNAATKGEHYSAHFISLPENLI